MNAIFLEPGMGGLETYVREVVPRMAYEAPASQFLVLCNRSGHRLLEAERWPGNVKLVVPRLIASRGLRAASELSVVGAWASRHCDVLLSPALTAPLATKAANVVLLADVTWLLFPDLEDGGSSTLRLWRLLVPPVARRADRVIALTCGGAREIEDRLGVPADRIDVIGLGCDSRTVTPPTPEAVLRRRLGLGDGPILLNVAAKKAHKNQMALIDAVPVLHAAGLPVSAVLAGAHTPYEDLLRERAEELGVGSSISTPGFVAPSDLEGLYQAAECLVFPSLNEGFGLPLLEAMERELPVVCSDVSVLPEVVGDAAVLVDPRSPDSVADGVARVLRNGDLRARLIEAGRKRAASFTWGAVARQTLDCLSRAEASGGADRRPAS